MLKGLKPGSAIDHKCPTCGKVHKVIPKNAKPYLLDSGAVQAWDFQCSCGSNMYIKNYTSISDLSEAL